jgi:hypothetical protein
MNKLKPGSIPKISTKGGQFKMMENINKFQDAIRKYGVPDIDVFQTVDLYERRNIPQVTQCIMALGRTVRPEPKKKKKKKKNLKFLNFHYFSKTNKQLFNCDSSAICTPNGPDLSSDLNLQMKIRDTSLKINCVLEKALSICNTAQTKARTPVV